MSKRCLYLPQDCTRSLLLHLWKFFSWETDRTVCVWPRKRTIKNKNNQHLRESLYGVFWLLDPSVRRALTRLPHHSVQPVHDPVSGGNVPISSLRNLYSIDVELDRPKRSRGGLMWEKI